MFESIVVIASTTIDDVAAWLSSITSLAAIGVRTHLSIVGKSVGILPTVAVMLKIVLLLAQEALG